MAKLGAIMANGGSLDGFKLIANPGTFKKIYEEMELQEDYGLAFEFLFTAGGLKYVFCDTDSDSC